MEMNKELLAKAKETKTPEELLALAKENGAELTEESAKAYFDRLHPQTGELSDDELDNVAGGGCYSSGGRLKTTCGHKCRHYVDGPSTFGVKGTCCRCLYWGVDPLAVKGGLWTTIIELTIRAAKAMEPRDCYHPANRRCPRCGVSDRQMLMLLKEENHGADQGTRCEGKGSEDP